jgi:hypothetical protein
MDVPYNNGKIKIGSAYYLNPLKPKYIEYDEDMLELQSYLIMDPRILNQQYWAKRIYILILLFISIVILMAH